MDENLKKEFDMIRKDYCGMTGEAIALLLLVERIDRLNKKLDTIAGVLNNRL